MFNYLWVVTFNAKRMLTNAFFFCRVYQEKVHVMFLARDHISENRYGEITSEYHFGMESLVIVTFLLSQCIESYKITRVPSPIISMIKRTALCLLVDSLRKQVTGICLGVRLNSGLFT